MSRFIPRLYCDSSLFEGGLISLCAEQHHYVANVMRMENGGILSLFNARDGEWQVEIQKLGKKSVEVKLGSQLCVFSSGAEIHLYLPPIKKERLRFLVEKATELGVTHFHPIITDHTTQKLNEEKLRATVVEAVEQSGRLDIPVIEEIKCFRELMVSFDKVSPLFVAVESFTEKRFSDYETVLSSPLRFVVGPEGGWSESETETLLNTSHVYPVSLGKNILRSETAGIFGISVLMELFHRKKQ